MGSFSGSSSPNERKHSGNPVLRSSVYEKAMSAAGLSSGSEVMTLDGAVNKIGMLLFIVVATSLYTYTTTITGEGGLGLTIFGAFAAFILAIITSFSPQRAPITAPLYAAFEGLFLGGISAYFELRYPGIIFQSIGLTMGIFAAMLAIYKFRIINVTNNFRLGVMAATGGVAIFYLGMMILQMFGIYLPSFGGGLFGIGISLFVIGIASMNLVLDFDFIEQGVEAEAPKFMEWYGAFGLMVTLVWLYVEVLRLFARSRD